MFSYGSFKGFLLKVCLGIFLSILSTLVLFVFFQNGIKMNEFIPVSSDAYSENLIINNILFVGNLFLIFFGAPLCIFSAFFLVVGVRLILGATPKYISIKIFLIIIFTIILNLLFKINDISLYGHVGGALYSLLPLFVEIYLQIQHNLYGYFNLQQY